MDNFFLFGLQVYYHLGEFDDSLNFALGAGALFDLSAKSEYVDTIICKCNVFSTCRLGLTLSEY